MGFSSALVMQNARLPSYADIIGLSHLVFRNPSDINRETPPMSHRKGFESGRKTNEQELHSLNFENRHKFYVFFFSTH